MKVGTLLNKSRNTQWILTAEALFNTQQLIKILEEKHEQLMKQLKNLSKNTPAQGGCYIFNTVTRKGAIDYQSIPALKKIDLEEFRKGPVVYWKLSRAETKELT